MELILTTNNKSSIAKIIALASELNIAVEQRGKIAENKNREELIKRILDFKSSESLSFGEPAEWERNEREDRDLPFSELK